MTLVTQCILYKLTLNKSQDNLRTQELSRKEAKGKGNE
jgi:hypothetical protein